MILTVSDANGVTAVVTLDLQVTAARPIPLGGTAGAWPGGGPLTDTLEHV